MPVPANQPSDLVWIDSAGFHYEDFPAFLDYYKRKYQGIYGGDVYLGNDAQDGQWLSVEAQMAYDTAALAAMDYLSFALASAQGTGLSRLVKLLGLLRNDPEFSTVDVDIGGESGTTIDNGIAIDTLNQQWKLPPSVTIPGGGTITVTATAAVKGAVRALADTITGIFTPTLGWQTVNNAADATVGSPVESDGTLRARGINSTSLPAQTPLEATADAIANVTGVTAVQPYENDTDSTDGDGLPPHSESFVVKGGTDADVARAIQIKKTPGTNTYGTTSVATVDSRGVPITIHFFRPTLATISVEVTVTQLAGWSNDYWDLINQAVADYINSIPIGGVVVITKIIPKAYVPGTAADGTFDIDLVRVKKNAGSFGTANITLAFNEIPFCDPATDVVDIP